MAVTSSVRKNLNELQNVAELLGAVSKRLTSGQKISSAFDGADAYYTSQNLTGRADALTSRMDTMQESVQVIKSADNGISTINKYLDQMQGIVDTALSSTDSDERRSLGLQYNELIKQVASIAQDSSYGGINLLSGNDSLTVEFGASIGESSLTLDGVNIQAGRSAAVYSSELPSSSVVGTQIVNGTNGVAVAVTTAYALTLDNGSGSVRGVFSAGTSGDSWEVDWGSEDYQTLLTSVSKQLDSFSGSLQNQSESLAADLSIITTREDFADSMATILQNGAAEKTETDLWEEAANMLSLQTSQELATESLALASDNARNVLSIIL